MTATDRILDALAALEAVMESVDYPARHHLAPGGSEEHIRDALAPTGLTVPDEVIQLWRWHNGRGSVSPRGEGDTWELPGGHDLLSVEAAARDWTWTREHFPWDQLDTIERDWLPIATTNPGTLWVDCSGPPTDPAPVYLERDASERADVDARRVGSVARMVELWTILLERGIWQLLRPGDIVTGLRGRTYPLRTDEPMWLFDDRHHDLPPDWPG